MVVLAVRSNLCILFIYNLLLLSTQCRPTPKSFSPSLCCSASSFSPEQRAEIIREVLEDLISPTDVAKKYNISPHSIRDWIKKTGQALPKSYKKPADYNRDKPAVPG
jgi:hypothetical protein